MKKRPGETQTLRAGCSKAEPEKFAPPQTPFPGAWDGQNLISWRWSLPLRPTYKPSLVRIDARNFWVIVVTDPPTHPQTNIQDRLQYTAPQLARSVKILLTVLIRMSINQSINQSMRLFQVQAQNRETAKQKEIVKRIRCLSWLCSVDIKLW